MLTKHSVVAPSVFALLVLVFFGCSASQSSGTRALDGGGDAQSSVGIVLCEGSPVPFCKPSCGANETAGEGTCATGNVCCYPHRDAGGPPSDAASNDAADATDALAE